MKDIKELIYAAVEENAVKFQELLNAQLQVRAYDAIEALRPEVGASMFGEAKECDDEEMEDDEDEDEEDEKKSEKKSEVDEELKGNQHKIDKNKNGKIDAHDFKLLRKEEVEELEEGPFKGVGKMIMKQKMNSGSTKSFYAGNKALSKSFDHDAGTPERDKKQDEFLAHAKDASRKSKIYNRLNREEVEVDEAVRIRDRSYSSIERDHGDDKKTFQGQMDRKHIAAGALARRKRTGPGVKGFNSAMRPAKASDGYQPRETGSVRAKNEEVVNEVAMPQNQADWQALITHQIKTTGHPVATDAQFRAAHGKDETKIASLEPGDDKLHYATAQGGTVKQ